MSSKLMLSLAAVFALSAAAPVPAVQWSCGFAELLEGVEKMSGGARLPAG